jgi:hypothetical protein
LFALCLIFSACSKEEKIVDTTPVPLNLNVEFPIKNADNETYPVTTWNTDAQLAALRIDKLHINKVIMSLVSGNAFKGMVPSNETNEDSDFDYHTFVDIACALNDDIEEYFGDEIIEDCGVFWEIKESNVIGG